MASSSIANMISGIRSWHATNGASWNGGPRLQMVLKGTQNLTPQLSHLPPRAPVTTHMLDLLYQDLAHRNAEDWAILAAATVAFWGQCRLGALLGTSSKHFNPQALPSRFDLGPPISARGSRLLHLPRTKTNQTRGESITITAQSSRADSIHALELHLHARPQLAAHAHLFAFIHKKSGSSKILTCERFLERCNAIWSKDGLPKFTGHAFRIGGTSHLLQSGVDPDVVKLMGRWSSDAFLKYWRHHHKISIQHTGPYTILNRSRTDQPPRSPARALTLRTHTQRKGGRT